MKVDEREDQAFEVLDEVVEHPETLRIFAALHVQQRPDLSRGERRVLVAHDNLQLLAADPVHGESGAAHPRREKKRSLFVGDGREVEVETKKTKSGEGKKKKKVRAKVCY